MIKVKDLCKGFLFRSTFPDVRLPPMEVISVENETLRFLDLRQFQEYSMCVSTNPDEIVPHMEVCTIDEVSNWMLKYGELLDGELEDLVRQAESIAESLAEFNRNADAYLAVNSA